jgi:hypothetical protein
MNFVGTIHANLRAALQSARRLKGSRVHPDTIEHWTGLVAVARSEQLAMESFRTRELTDDLEREIRERRSAGE